MGMGFPTTPKLAPILPIPLVLGVENMKISRKKSNFRFKKIKLCREVSRIKPLASKLFGHMLRRQL